MSKEDRHEQFDDLTVAATETLPSGEILLTSNGSQWFAGAFEIGGSLGFGLQRLDDPRRRAATPFIGIQFSDPVLPLRLKDEFGGSAATTSNPNGWRLSGMRAAEMATQLQGLVITREEKVAAMEEWLGVVGDRDQQIQIAKRVGGKDRLVGFDDPESMDDAMVEYADLVRLPFFVAGVLDNRASIYPDASYGRPIIEIASTNMALLGALRQQFGGNIRVRVRVGEEKVVGGRAFVVKRDSCTWQITHAAATEMLEFVGDAMRIQPYENWNVMVSDQIRQEREATIREIDALICGELAAYDNGERPTLSTSIEIARFFGLTPRIAVRYLQRSEASERRAQVIKATVRRVISDTEAAVIAAEIEVEVRRHVERGTGDLMTNHDYADANRIGRHILSRHVIPLLDPELSEYRQRELWG